MNKIPTSVLVDKRNIHLLKDQIIAEMQNVATVGIDTEGYHDPHPALEEFSKSRKSTIFDREAMTLAGVSIYAHGSDKAYYFNLAHKDVENRLDFEVDVKPILEAKPEDCYWISHNAPFELMIFQASHNYWLKNVVCTLQMAVTAFGPDEYDHNEYINARLGSIPTLFDQVQRVFGTFDPSRRKLNPFQQELLGKVIAKESIASFSYNGLIKSIAYSYGLKKLIKKFFDVDMTHYEDVVKPGTDMRHYTGEEVLVYGAEDAFWANELFYHLYMYMKTNCPNAIKTFFEQENPMVYVFAETRLAGLRINTPEVVKYEAQERAEFAKVLRRLKAVLKNMLPFGPQPHEALLAKEKWYAKEDKSGEPTWQKYRSKLESYIQSPDSEDDLEQVSQVSCSVSKSWNQGKKVSDVSIMHYYLQRIMMYDLAKMDPILVKGQVQSDGEARGKLKEKAAESGREEVVKMLDCTGEMAGIDQRIKLYLHPYQQLVSPRSGKVFPELTCMLATRRMAMSNPNGMQLAKRGVSTYVRGFYLPDDDNQVLVSLDWSQIELVLIGEFSGDPEFKQAYGQLPYNDLHIGSTVAGLQVMVPEVTEEMFRSMARMTEADAAHLPPQLLTNIKGELMTAPKAYKYWRTELGKKMNFGYWYSGALSDTATAMGWTEEQMWEAVEAYRARFAVAEEWRVRTISDGRFSGFVELPDGTRRFRWEATYDWKNVTQSLFNDYNNSTIAAFGQEVIRSTMTRAGNQLINAMIQGSCATIAKRSILRINKLLKESNIRARFALVVHDELVYSVHREDVVKFLKAARTIMTSHPEIFKSLVVNCSASVGLTFEPFDDKKARFGQLELDEAPGVDFVPEQYWGKPLPMELVDGVIDELYKRRTSEN